MLGYSGIGTYLSNVLPGVLARCQALEPTVIVPPRLDVEQATTLAGLARSIASRVRPLTLGEAWRPPAATHDALWWTPHFNVPLRFGGRLVVTLHDLLPLAERRGALLPRAAVAVWLRQIRKRAARVICDSEFTRRQAVELGGIERTRTRVVPLGVRPSTRPRTDAEPPYVLFVGILKPHKNLGALARAFSRISEQVPHRLVVVARRTGLRDVDRDALAAVQQLGSRAELTENVSADALAALMCDADVLVQPSLAEGFGLPPLEAMAAGTPVLAARAGALPEVCGDAARYCDPRSERDIAEQLLELLSDAALRVRLAAAGRARAASYTWERCADGTAQAILEAAELPPGNASS